MSFSNLIYRLISGVFATKLFSGECSRFLLMTSKYWFRYWLSKVITWAHADTYLHLLVQLNSLLHPGIVLWMHPANERRLYNVMSSLIGWVYLWNDPCTSFSSKCSPKTATGSFGWEVWSVFCEFKIWFMFYTCHHYALCTMCYDTVSQRDSTANCGWQYQHSSLLKGH